MELTSPTFNRTPFEAANNIMLDFQQHYRHLSESSS